MWIYECVSPITQPTTNVAIVSGVGGRDFGLDFRVNDWAAARVDPFNPSLAIEKTADPTELVEGGPVTYTYEVTNTGDVPLAGVAETITDDTCAPVEYVSGDIDGDGLLDTPRSIFEDKADETWVFTLHDRRHRGHHQRGDRDRQPDRRRRCPALRSRRRRGSRADTL